MKNKSSTRVQKDKMYIIINYMSMSPYIMHMGYISKVLKYINCFEIITLDQMNRLFQYSSYIILPRVVQVKKYVSEHYDENMCDMV